uniref:Uncharacterized protein n=1 Tax=Avena sativa TaxID=4498 RepID=A0ACD5U2U7_AVESA
MTPPPPHRAPIPTHNRSVARTPADRIDPPIAECDFSLRGKPMMAEEAATGEVAPLKRKLAAGECEALDMFPAKETAPAIIPHWAGPLSKPAAATGNRKLLERVALEPMAAELFSEDAELLERVKETLLTFPESKALSARQLQEAIDRVVRESKPETASVAAPGMVRLQDDDIRVWLFLLETSTVDDILGVDAGRVFPPRWIDERKMYLDEQCQVKNKKPGQNLLLVHKIRIDLITKGYVEVQKEYVQSDSEDEDEDEGEDACPYDSYGPEDEVQGGVVLLI